jgi:hypothetical protein
METGGCCCCYNGGDGIIRGMDVKPSRRGSLLGCLRHSL